MPKLQRGTFQLIADAMSKSRPCGGDDQEEVFEQWEDDCRALADALSGTNPNFNRYKFLAACGWES